MRDLSLEVVDAAADIAVGRAIFKNMGENRIIDLRMTRIGETWKVFDILYQRPPLRAQRRTLTGALAAR